MANLDWVTSKAYAVSPRTKCDWTKSARFRTACGTRAIGMMQNSMVAPTLKRISPALAAFRRFLSPCLPFSRGTVVFRRRLPPWVLKTTGGLMDVGLDVIRGAPSLRNGRRLVFKSTKRGPRIGRAHAPRIAAAFRKILGCRPAGSTGGVARVKQLACAAQYESGMSDGLGGRHQI